MTQTVSVPVEKIVKAKELVKLVLLKKKVTVHQIQKLCGFLNFLCRAIVPGRAFTRRLYASYAGSKLKPHHHIYIKSENRLDLKIWNVFLEHPSVFARPFMDFANVLSADQIFFYTDSSGNKNLGMGGICVSSWMYSSWDSQFVATRKPSIQYLELYALTAAIIAWIHRYQNRRVIVFCDNNSVVNMLNQGTSGCKQCMVLIRIITLHCMVHNVCVFGEHLSTTKNDLADALSRLKLKKFFKLAQRKGLYLDPYPTPVPELIWPMKKIWAA